MPQDLETMKGAGAQDSKEREQAAGTGAAYGKRAPLVLALAGNPNAGKTTAFNHYTGSRQHVANYPGITVERKVGSLEYKGRKIRMLDLPGTYALTAYSQDELVARRGLTEEAPECVIDVLNASALERNLYLAVQIMELGLPMVLALNMFDEARKQGVEINHQKLAELLGVPVLPTVARTGEGMDAVLEAAVEVAEKKRSGSLTTEISKADRMMPVNGEPLFISYGPDVDPVIDELVGMLEGNGLFNGRYPLRWVAVKYLESDAEIRGEVARTSPDLAKLMDSKVEELAKHLEATVHSYPEAIIADYRYGFISSILRQGVIARHGDVESRVAMSDRMDTVLTHRLFGPLLMIGILWLMYKITFGIGEIPMGWVEDFFGWLNGVVSANMSDGMLKSMIVSGVIDGVGSVMGFVPLILVMFLLISFLEDSGYMARVAYMLDRIFRAFGLHGYSVMPFIVSGGIAGGCAVPGMMATRTLRSPKEKLATMMTLPFMTCGAKLPVFLLLVAAFFPEHPTMVMVGISVFAWVMALLVSRLLRSTIIKGEATPFVMELPPYRMPTLFGVVIHTWERVWQYIKKAGTIILAISILIWAGMTYPEMPDEMAEPFDSAIAALEERIDAAGDDEEAVAALEEEKSDAENAKAQAALRYSVAGRLGTAIEPVTAPAGFDWQVNIALLGGVAAKEVIVSTLGTAYSLSEVDEDEPLSLVERIQGDPRWTPATAASLIVFVLLYAPCFVTLVVMKQEAGSWKWAAFSLVFNTLLAFVAAATVYQVGTLILSS